MKKQTLTSSFAAAVSNLPFIDTAFTSAYFLWFDVVFSATGAAGNAPPPYSLEAQKCNCSGDSPFFWFSMLSKYRAFDM